jgi:antitoxin component YwqK of YwqJK toxin-antitoxin module
MSAPSSGRLEEYGIDPNTSERLKVVRETVARNEDRIVYHVDNEGFKHGTYRRYTGGSKGVLQEELVYKHGRVHGQFTSYHPSNGKIWQQGTYLDGLRDGLFQHWYPNSILAHKCFYTKGKLDGEMMDYYLDGKSMQQRFYLEGVLTGSIKTWSSDGKLFEDRR